MPRTWENERTVVSVLTDKGYYPSGGGSQEELQGQMVEEEVVRINGKPYTLSRISKWDVKTYADQLDRVLRRENPFIWDIYALFAAECLAAMRLANVDSKQGFGGVGGGGNALDFTLMGAREFYDPDSSGNTRTSWVRTISSTGSKNIIEGATTGAALTLGEATADVYLAFYNPAVTPCLDAVQNILNTDTKNVQTIDFEKVHAENGEVVLELKEAFIIPPEEAYEILGYYFRTGTDESRPIGLRFKQAKDLRDLTDIRLE